MKTSKNNYVLQISLNLFNHNLKINITNYAIYLFFWDKLCIRDINKLKALNIVKNKII